MKRYISAILIPCFLLQLCGCYSLEKITLSEMINENELVITTNDSLIYELVKDIDKNKILSNPKICFSKNWIINQETETINMKTFQSLKYSNKIEGWQIKEDTVILDYGDISSVESVKFNLGDTFLYSGITLVSLFALFAFIGLAGMGGGL